MNKWYICFILGFLVEFNLSAIGPPLTIDQIFSPSEFDLHSAKNVQWLPNTDKLAFLKIQKGTNYYELWTFEPAIDKFQLIFKENTLQFKENPLYISDYRWAKNGSIILTCENDLYRFDPGTREIERLTHDVSIEHHLKISPDGKKLIYTKKGNLFVYEINNRIERQLTHNYDPEILIGQFDHVYQTQFSMKNGFEWSPDSKYLAFYQLDTSLEPEYPVEFSHNGTNVTKRIKYPRAGDPHAKVRIGIMNVQSATVQWIEKSTGPDHYITRLCWLPNSRQLCLTWSNRQQNSLELFLADIRTGKARSILKEQVETGWLDVMRRPLFISNQKFLWLSDLGGFNQIYLWDLWANKKQLTHDHRDIKEIKGADQSSVFFSAAVNRIEKGHLFSVLLDGGKSKQLTKRPGSHQILLSPTFQYFFDTCSSFQTPDQQNVYKISGEWVALLGNDSIKRAQSITLAKINFFTFITSEMDTLDAFIIKPATFDPSIKYPVVMYTYAGPESQVVYDRWMGKRGLWYSLMSQKGYLIFAVDGRGSANKGRDWRMSVHRRLGDIEIQDQIEGIKYLKSLPYVDKDRIGIYGWSYGGYASLMCMLKGADDIRAGIAISPVTDWRNYDCAYTECYMGSLQSNSDGYKKASALNLAHRLNGKLLIVHGMSDHNVHLENTLEFIAKLQLYDLPYELLLMPGQHHSLSDSHAQKQLYQRMTLFFENNL